MQTQGRAVAVAVSTGENDWLDEFAAREGCQLARPEPSNRCQSKVPPWVFSGTWEGHEDRPTASNLDFSVTCPLAS